MKVQASNSRASAATWRIGFGVGGGEAANKVQVSFSAAFSAGPGECKRVFLPIKARVDRLHLIRISKARTRGAASSPDIRELLRADRPGVRRNDLLVRMPDQLRLLPPSSTPIPSVRTLQRPHLNRGSEAANYPLGGDVSGAPAEYEYIQETTSDYRVSLGSEAHGVKVGATAGVAITNRLSLRISLAGGHNYRLMSVTDRPGIYWE